MSRYLDRLRDLNSQNAPPLGTAITVKSPSDSFDSSEGCRVSESNPPAPDAWTSRRELICDTWHREWTAALTRETVWLRTHPDEPAPTDEALRDLLTATVTGWTARTGDRHTTDELRRELSADDLADRELMTRPWLALYCWTLWHPAPEAA